MHCQVLDKYGCKCSLEHLRKKQVIIERNYAATCDSMAANRKRQKTQNRERILVVKQPFMQMKRLCFGSKRNTIDSKKETDSERETERKVQN